MSYVASSFTVDVTFSACPTVATTVTKLSAYIQGLLASHAAANSVPVSFLAYVLNSFECIFILNDP